MNKAEIANLFIKAAFIDSRLPISEGPKRLKAAWFTGAALTEADQHNWSRRDEGDKPSQIHKTDKGPMHDWWMAFWDGRSVDTSRNDVRLWELANALIVLVADEQNRRALWAWSMAKVGTLIAHETKTRKTRKFDKVKMHKRTGKDVSFAAWCKAEGIHEMTGSRRKDRAIAIIEQHLVRGSSSNIETGDLPLLPVGPVFEHISDNIAADASKDSGPTFERDRDTVFCKEATIFNWREIRNEQRRQRDAKKRQAAA